MAGCKIAKFQSKVKGNQKSFTKILQNTKSKAIC